MITLAIDTSNRPLTVAVLDGKQLLATTTLTTHRKHAEFLLPIVEELVARAELTPTDLQRIVVAYGPGSYTGIRMAVTLAKTLSSTLNIEIVTVSSLLSLALNESRPDVLINPIFDGRNQNMFTGLYRWHDNELIPVIEDQHINLVDWLPKLKQQTLPIIALGEINNFTSIMKEQLGERISFRSELMNIPNAAKLGIYGQQLEPVKVVGTVVPNYLRLTKAEADWRKEHPEAGDGNYVEKV
ncbi:tRNA (adenosine(37)-N6)-threonylcarbamoyltransferase complex dimerization subunit type 1 TsaB [Lentilactobacillus kribbianus]|uniref:tRNA (adenosine(37)-N6)-threonylcarbamoyltransferase complex dimerization subunit type 1 TsaB n=1 Tax=Lentilactobacillus kribbianus TaxID=2729622 RepID=UPI001552AD01|nr:tRNA (adenosine(37)-N6)-threonylcarbamoyltransferase complex dimerization subunit type 1 TsaB [Lentilactobacillus kribbianus]